MKNKLFALIRPFFAFSALLLCSIVPVFGVGSENIRINQIGFYQYGPKMAAIVTSHAWRFTVKSTDLSTTYYSGDLRPPALWPAADETAAIADFSDFTRVGTYVLDVSGVGVSYPFRIEAGVHRDLMKGLLKAFYYQRASTSLAPQYAGKWSRNEGHADTKVIVHSSAASDPSKPHARKTGDIFPSPKGWYDAGDYGKYTVNAGISTYTLLALYEQFHGFFDTVSLNIPPQSGLPDLLTEIKWELDWLLTMQDPSDGGVYHKLTSLNFCGFIMPEADNGARYFIGKATAATFDFAAVCAVASRVYRKDLPQFADSCLAAAKYAWTWGSAHPNAAFRNPPDVSTGEYGDGNLGDEMQWASQELYVATGDTVYESVAKKFPLGFSTPTWQTVSMLGTYSLAYINKDSAATANIITLAQGLGTYVDATAFHTVMYDQFYWGSNGLAANEGMAFIEAFLATRNVSYFEKAVHTLDYLLGRNALGVCFVTDFGSLSPKNPSHRPSVADGIPDPVPGLLVGGPNAGKNDTADCTITYPSASAKCWVDLNCAYACNEVAINWNAPAAFLAGAIEAIYADTSYHVYHYNKQNASLSADSMVLTGLAADRVTIALSTVEEVSTSIKYGLDSALNNAKLQFCSDSLPHTTTITGLSPATTYYFRSISTDDFDSVTIGPLHSFSTPDGALINGFSFDPASIALTPGNDVKISFAGQSGLSAHVRYSIGGNSKIGSIACTENSGMYTATIPGSNSTAAGLLVSIALSSAADSSMSPVYALAPSSPIQLIDTLPYAKTYYLLSFPLLQTIPKPINWLGRQLGDTSTWRYYGYSSQSETYTADDTIKSGQGKWLYVGGATTLSVQAAAPKPDSLFSIPLSQGWNLVGSPFAFPIFWENSLIRFNGNMVRISDNASQQLIRRQWFRYIDTTADRTNNGQYVSNRDVLLADTTRLVPWSGYWVYAEKSDVELILNPAATPPLQQALAKKKVGQPSAWNMRITASSGGAIDNTTIIGESPDALDAYDKFDSPKPPQLSRDVAAGIVRQTWPHGKTGLFAVDIAHYSNTSSYEWPVSVTALGKGLKLTWNLTGNVSGTLSLMDSITGAIVNMSTENSYSFTFIAGEHNRLLKVKLSPLAGSILPAHWFLGQTAPNPFKASTKIRFSVPALKTGNIAPNSVIISVFDIMGRRVKNLLAETKYSGNYSIVWTGTDDDNKRLPQGVYIVHLSADGFSGSVKTHLIH